MTGALSDLYLVDTRLGPRTTGKVEHGVVYKCRYSSGDVDPPSKRGGKRDVPDSDMSRTFVI